MLKFYGDWVMLIEDMVMDKVLGVQHWNEFHSISKAHQDNTGLLSCFYFLECFSFD